MNRLLLIFAIVFLATGILGGYLAPAGPNEITKILHQRKGVALFGIEC